MNESINIDEAYLIAAMASPQSKSGFSRAKIVVRGSGKLVQAQTYDNDRIIGPRLTYDQLEEFFDSGQALSVKMNCKVVYGLALWILRRRLPCPNKIIKDLYAASVIIHPPVSGPNGSWLCAVDESSRSAAKDLRDRWRDEAMVKAWNHIISEDWNKAEAEAEFAYQFSRGLEPKSIALLSLAYEKNARKTRAHGLLDIAKKSRGIDFESRVKDELNKLTIKLASGESI